MRQNFIIVLLSVCSTLLAVNLFVALRSPEIPLAFSQGVGTPTGSAAIAAVISQQGEPWCFVYDVGSQRLGAYTASKNQGVALTGVRHITYDLKVVSFASQGKNYKPNEIKKELEKQASTGEEGK
jgi:hypothetical protein